MKTIHFLTIAVFVAFFTGCATVAPNELVDARTAYQQASEGPAAQLVPAELHKAQEALNLAEQSFRKDPDSYKTKDLAYAAQRKSEQAGALGAIAADRSRKDRANADFQTKQTEIVNQGKQDLSDSERQTADARAELDKQAAVKAEKDKSDTELAAVRASKEKSDAELQKQQAETVQQGKQDLSDSEKRTAAALDELAKLAAVKEEERGLVITLPGSVLFQSAKSTLMPSAQVKLDQVAKALLEVRTRNLIVEGHTDSRGSESYNQGLSQRRADAVRDYLVKSSYPADHIQSRGMGKGSPIADNSSAEGRANNRRVEIVIERESQASNQ
ncbi:MAG: Peptidoglycan-associated lipoprotein [Syntrophus sp. SKADARSKE-3]|nr:Peptidoglycan-associated lipoprotein [Syntrophus sp. SKADARSKE-3]